MPWPNFPRPIPENSTAPRGSRGLRASPARVAELQGELRELRSWTLTPRQLCDLELLAVGGFAPLDGFLGSRAFESVCRDMRLPDGRLWPIPVTLDVADEIASRLEIGALLALRDAEGLPLAVISVDEIFEPDRDLEAEAVYGTLDGAHPGVEILQRRTHRFCVAGELEVLRLPPHADFAELRLTPDELKRDFERRGWRRVVAFQTRNPMHRAHYELTLRAAEQIGGNLLIHPAVGQTRPGDIDHFTRVRCCQFVLERYPPGMARLALLPLAMRMAGPREALLHAIVRRNYGCTHFIVGRDHAGPGAGPDGRPFYESYEAQELVKRHEAEVGVTMIPFREMLYLPAENRFAPEDEIAPESAGRALSLSGTELRRRLDRGEELPDWFTFPEVARELARRHPPRRKQGVTVFFTGLSGAGKSTIARALELRLLEIGGRPVTLLDGDVVRRNLSSELGFTKAHRDLNIRRIGFVAAEITKNRGIAICAPIAPYDAPRRDVRRTISAVGGFLEVWVSTPLAVCEARDVKGLYAKARAGQIESFTGISDPYEEPRDAELVLDASQLTPEQAVQEIVIWLERQGYLGQEPR